MATAKWENVGVHGKSVKVFTVLQQQCDHRKIFIKYDPLFSYWSLCSVNDADTFLRFAELRFGSVQMNTCDTVLQQPFGMQITRKI